MPTGPTVVFIATGAERKTGGILEAGNSACLTD